MCQLGRDGKDEGNDAGGEAACQFVAASVAAVLLRSQATSGSGHEKMRDRDAHRQTGGCEQAEKAGSAGVHGRPHQAQQDEPEGARWSPFGNGQWRRLLTLRSNKILTARFGDCVFYEDIIVFDSAGWKHKRRGSSKALPKSVWRTSSA
jgi:hypothetical protein